ncbi:ABC transporter transmembrane domain-containing protein [Lichenifustis flavocetrariae]|uniref:ABC transporter ATP-binding protein n=1 Tax=Lichenifustis flavocetrariae TaxID=2949735 RepID=A0AA42CKS9_9HYPH|nr:ABC transporter transmembrane domain-containing protein [Lichenifustis flavocetrariae]MCW6509601.1 ABC transporter ATP-binding protein [Lichenifustis flavocetrariae]
MKARSSQFSLWPSPWRANDGGRTLSGEHLPRGYYGLVWRISGGDQVWLCALSGLIAILNTAPIEIQRRVVDRSLKEGNFHSLGFFVLAYACVVVLQGSLKLLFNIYRSWVAEHATRSLRSFINRRQEGVTGAPAATAASEGTDISMIISESEPVGAFMGESISEVALQAGIMISVIGYLIVLQPVMAIVIAAVFLPQFIFVPLMQRAITRRAEERIATLRSASAALVGEEDGETRRKAQDDRFAHVFDLNMGVFKFKFTMNFLTNLCHQLGIAGILGIGGWFVVSGRTQVGTIVAFISGLATIKDPWDDLTTWYQSMTVTRARYKLLFDALATG